MPGAENKTLFTTMRANGDIELALRTGAMPEISGDQDILVEMLAAPINPSDIGTLLGHADPRSARPVASKEGPITLLTGASDASDGDALRVGRPLVVGNEGAGRVVAAGRSPEAQAVLGKLVAVMGGGMYTRYRVTTVANSLELPGGVSAAQGAAAFINPLTALCMLETMRTEGFRALVNTAAASNLGLMLQRLCSREGVDLVNIVRSDDQALTLREIGAQFVCDSSAPSFLADLTASLRATGATLAFDAVGGGSLASDILSCMEEACRPSGAVFSRYGTTTFKKIYNYGGLDPTPMIIRRDVGMSWSVGGWLLLLELQKLAPERVAGLKKRVADGLLTTFASEFGARLSFEQMLSPVDIGAYAKRATGQKYLLDPTL